MDWRFQVLREHGLTNTNCAANRLETRPGLRVISYRAVCLISGVTDLFRGASGKYGTPPASHDVPVPHEGSTHDQTLSEYVIELFNRRSAPMEGS
jgi:hypothetical protein